MKIDIISNKLKMDLSLKVQTYYLYLVLKNVNIIFLFGLIISLLYSLPLAITMLIPLLLGLYFQALMLEKYKNE